jgi:[FeFe] hydrogenase H-cluster maturation GTPase HydF
MQNTPVSNRIHIGIFGRRNVGKSSFINALTGQNLAIVSEVPGTTTDPVYKTIEILPEPGPCVVIDTAGLDDEGSLGELRKIKSKQVLNKTDIALFLIDPDLGLSEFDEQLIKEIQDKEIPVIIVFNKIDTVKGDDYETGFLKNIPTFKVSSKTGEGINNLRENLKKHIPSKIEDLSIVKGIVKRGDTVVLVIPIDSAMPKGRLILPEVQTLRAILDADAHALVCKEYELERTLLNLNKAPDLVITDSQVFHYVKDLIPETILLTSFSLLFARYKGDIRLFAEGANAIDRLKSNSYILIAEACTHHPQPEDIAKVKIPGLLKKKLGDDLRFEFVSGSEFPDDVSKYDLIIMCGSCMVNHREVKYRMSKAQELGVPVTNYGLVFAKMNGILDRASWLWEETCQ